MLADHLPASRFSISTVKIMVILLLKAILMVDHVFFMIETGKTESLFNNKAIRPLERAPVLETAGMLL